MATDNCSINPVLDYEKIPDLRDHWLSTHYVGQALEKVQEFAGQVIQNGYNNSMAFLEALANTSLCIDNVEVNINWDIQDPNITIDYGDKPIPVNVQIPDPQFPDERIPYPIPTPDWDLIGDLPTFDIPDPNINIPEFSTQIPMPDSPGDAPAIDLDIEYPDIADYFDINDLPLVPTFEELNLPPAPDITIPDYELLLPAIPGIDPPDNTFTFVEEAYISSLLDALKSSLEDRIVNGGTGLNPVVEQAIWDRARNREDKNAKRSREELLTQQSSRGFSKPQGALTAGLSYLAQETQNKNADLSREIAIKQAELEQENVKHALTTAVQLEQVSLNFHSQVMDRALEAEKAAIKAAVDIYQANIAFYTMQLEAYKAYSVAYEAQVRAALSKAEIFKAEIEAQSLLTKINESYVQLYIAQLDGIKTSVGVYTTQIDAAKTQLEAESIKLQAYKTEVEAFSTIVGAKRDEYAMFGELVKAEGMKADVYDSQVKAFVSRIQGYAAQVDALTSETELNIKIEDSSIKSYLSQLQAINTKTETQAKIALAQIDAYKAEVQAWSTQIAAEGTLVDAEVKEYMAKIDMRRAQVDLNLKNAQIELDNANRNVALQLEALKAGQAASTGLAQSAFGVLNTNLSASQGFSTNNNYNYERE